MNIALIGYGKMGHTIERIAADRGHSIVLKITSANRQDFTAERLAAADVAIEFTSPEAAPENVSVCLHAGIPVICGTTGWNDQLDAIKTVAEKQGVGFLHASNFSIGVNIFFEVNRLLARLMAGQEGYHVSMQEIHHLQKKDKPSGTAITLAEQIIAESDLKSWVLSDDVKSGEDMLKITALREEGVAGTHSISWASSVDTINLIHIAHSRDGFALGAVLAAEFIRDRNGVFAMNDVLGI